MYGWGHAAPTGQTDWNANGSNTDSSYAESEGWNGGAENWNGQAESWNEDANWNGNGERWNENASAEWTGGESWNSGTAWESPADPEPSDEYRPAYTFRTASGEPLEFSHDGARLDQAAVPDQTTASDAVESAPATSRSATRAAARNRRRSGGAHRLPAPPAALKGRAAVVAVAAGAVVAAGQTGMETSAPATGDIEAVGQMTELAAQSISLAGEETVAAESPQVLNVSTPMDLNQFSDILQKGQQFAADLAAQEAAKLRPLFTRFANGNFTSGYGARWGVQHLGIDVAAPIGTPIYAVADGTVIEAGPASGFGMWVRLLHDDGTVTVYGHIDTATVSQGMRVMAGDQIATVGNRGFSTGPHCHFEVWLNGVDKIDPVPWLASRGISLGMQRD
ncbi:M23 family metallopeptidase [Nocardia uniformis]|uniref:M23 family metallopeptidase n=1 Tax=Nocardia uniformis TaxID=53432 RepID=UPI000A03CC01